MYAFTPDELNAIRISTNENNVQKQITKLDNYEFLFLVSKPFQFCLHGEAPLCSAPCHAGVRLYRTWK
jgi:hypothetical protein